MEGRNKVGTGLGLSICKQIIEQMGGCVSVNSQEAVGTNFVIDIKTKCRRVQTVLTEKEEFKQGQRKSNVQDRSLSVIQSCLDQKKLTSSVKLARIDNGTGFEADLENENDSELLKFYKEMVLKV